jgi:hypothetical protein
MSKPQYVGVLGPMLWFKKYFRRKIQRKKLAFFTQNKGKLCKIFYHNIGFWEKSQFFCRKLAKIAENCDHNIDPWSTNLHIARCLFWWLIPSWSTKHRLGSALFSGVTSKILTFHCKSQNVGRWLTIKTRFKLWTKSFASLVGAFDFKK